MRWALRQWARRHPVVKSAADSADSVAKALRRADVDLTVIDRTNHDLSQPRLHQLATGILSEGDIAPPIRDVRRRQRNTRVLPGEVIDLDRYAPHVTSRRLAGVVTSRTAV
jgi:NADH:ubiquinone reductase (H+-translocating)